MHQQITTVLFDLDGTLIDSMWMWKQIDIDFLGSRGIECPDDLQQTIEGLSFRDTAVYFKETFSLPESLEEIQAIWNEMSYEMYCTKVPLKPYAKEFIQYLSSLGMKLGIATSNSRELTLGVLKAHGIDAYFDTIVTSREVPKGKPAPDVYLRAAADLKSAPKECVVFEDIPAGLLAAKRAGMLAVAVEDSYSAYCREEKKQLADAYILDYRTLLDKERNAP